MNTISITVQCGDSDNDPITIGWTGDAWVPVSGHARVAQVMCELANVVVSEIRIGEHHLPAGVMMAQSVAQRVGGKIVVCPPWGTPLPVGAIS